MRRYGVPEYRLCEGLRETVQIRSTIVCANPSFIAAQPWRWRHRRRPAQSEEGNRCAAAIECRCGVVARVSFRWSRLLLELMVAAGNSNELQEEAAKKPDRDPSAPAVAAWWWQSPPSGLWIAKLAEQPRDAAHSEPQDGATSSANTVTIAAVAPRQLLAFPGTAGLSFFCDFPTLRPGASGVN